LWEAYHADIPDRVLKRLSQPRCSATSWLAALCLLIRGVWRACDRSGNSWRAKPVHSDNLRRSLFVSRAYGCIGVVCTGTTWHLDGRGLGRATIAERLQVAFLFQTRETIETEAIWTAFFTSAAELMLVGRVPPARPMHRPIRPTKFLSLECDAPDLPLDILQRWQNGVFPLATHQIFMTLGSTAQACFTSTSPPSVP
jgi:hypothetical protein